ncbi:23S rRNA (uracil(1939)-C(5))-methyltransferase RlmD [Lentilactobacillus kefiri]|uniref:RNA methyltransferase, TrmA family n=2 Tax=Lentilactobacillus kefiri TaxID=33962 RepID=A0A8E1RHU1_LENKE|nr:23S rRNA (uracil(1939)-C(5))-methyltransferase RlmD [Lentilactobacillus kefiri]KRL62225.1 RNA methyltransferase, TrmA family [Lentilactobacillus parakefiri DSM 10551]KRM49498.1 RNA methyltransferase, TrmA family [Lentilactobacillus kefiri DSM 20587 = JCM 5818]MCJ2162236.1 23S rRNA (uracil(1939)-C(5))-methyltransferase RlmD [Lentilactobacillus kefiri]MCP9368597.1 23S rRNA (uracil(1939)-C(5))-methyltransferase RlmD [Lentilactobacillus kefiri]MDH5107637.1 23S rRNA (uracil(1939)-C(5))-methyltra
MKKSVPVEKNQNYDVDISDLTYQGLGVAKIDDFPIFIENALPTENVTMKVIKVKKNFAFGRVVKINKKSKDRVELVDKAYTQTGIAPLQHLKYDAQLKFKQHQIEVDFSKMKLDVKVDPTIGMDDPTHYRNKAQIPVRMINGKLQTGFYRKHSHDLVPIEDFYIQDPKIDEAIVVVRDILRKFRVQPYDEESNKGVVRNIMVRRGHYSHEMMIVLITRTEKLPSSGEIIAEITKSLPEVKSIVQNVNPQKTNALMGKKNKVLAGKSTIEDTLLGLKFNISASSFYQVNPVQTEKLYDLATKKADLSADDVVIDAYCGIGTISLSMARIAKQVYGVEIVPEAVEDAKKNAKLNDLTNVHFVAAKAEDQMAKWQEDGLKPDVISVDPPRKGLDASLIDSVVKMQPKRVVYVSCNPATLVRDVKLFSDQGYEVNQPIQPVDQFPQTVHVESITVLERQK